MTVVVVRFVNCSGCEEQNIMFNYKLLENVKMKLISLITLCGEYFIVHNNDF